MIQKPLTRICDQKPCGDLRPAPFEASADPRTLTVMHPPPASPGGIEGNPSRVHPPPAHVRAPCGTRQLGSPSSPCGHRKWSPHGVGAACASPPGVRGKRNLTIGHPCRNVSEGARAFLSPRGPESPHVDAPWSSFSVGTRGEPLALMHPPPASTRGHHGGTSPQAHALLSRSLPSRSQSNRRS